MAELKGLKVADNYFCGDGKLPTLYFQELESCRPKSSKFARRIYINSCVKQLNSSESALEKNVG